MIQSQKRQIRLLPMLFAACVALFLASGAAQAQPKDIALTASPSFARPMPKSRSTSATAAALGPAPGGGGWT